MGTLQALHLSLQCYPRGSWECCISPLASLDVSFPLLTLLHPRGLLPRGELGDI